MERPMEPIVVRHLARSSLAGSTQSFAEDRVRLGRRAGNEVAFDRGHDLLVSGCHAELRREGGRLVLTDLGSRNGTFVNGARIAGAARISPGDRISLGARGPELMATLGDGGGAEEEAVGGDRAPRGVRGLREVVQPLSATDRRPAVDSVDATLPPRPFGDADRPVARSASDRAPIGMMTLMGILERKSARDRRRLVKALASTAAASIALATLGFALLAPSRADVAPVAARDAAQAFDVSGSIEEVRRGTYVVVARHAVGSSAVEAMTGTAWSVAPGWLATNAHVADGFDGADTSRTMVARGADGGDVRIVGARVHPGYRAFEDLMERLRPVSVGERDGVFQVHPPCDVALLEVHPEDAPRQAAALPLADDEVLRALRPGAGLATVGYPGEGMSGGGTDLRAPEPKSFVFPLSGVSTVFLGRAADFADGINLTYQVESAGGASGSPAFDAAGRVVGLLSAGNMVGLHRDGSRDMGGGCMYGPRVDVLRELLEDRADEAQRDRTRAWESWFRDRHHEAMVEPRVPALVWLRLQLAAVDEVGDVKLLDETAGTISGPRAGWRGRLSAPGPGAYSVCALSDPPVPLTLRIPAVRGLESVESPSWFVTAAMRLGGGGPIDLELVASPPPGEAGPVAVRVFLARAE